MGQPRRFRGIFGAVLLLYLCLVLVSFVVGLSGWQDTFLSVLGTGIAIILLRGMRDGPRDSR